MNFIVSGEYPLGELFLFKQGIDRVVRRCILEYEVHKVIECCHASPFGDHHGRDFLLIRYYNLVSFGPHYLNILLLL